MDQTILPEHIITGSQDGIIRVLVFDPVSKTIRLKKEFYGATEPVTGLFIDQQKKKLVSTSKEAYSKVWDLKDFSFIVSLVGHRDNTSCAAFGELDGRQIVATGSWDQRINVYTL